MATDDSRCNLDEESAGLTEEVIDVWGSYDDFDSLDYIAFVMEENARELREAETWDDAEGELADQYICAVRALAEKGCDPVEVARTRLYERMAGKQESIIATYKDRYDATLRPVAPKKAWFNGVVVGLVAGGFLGAMAMLMLVIP